MGANVKLAGAMTTATQSLSSMNKTMNPEQLNRTMQEFGKATAKMEMTEEMMNDALDDILNESGDEEEGESIVQQVLDEIGIDISSKVRKLGYFYLSRSKIECSLYTGCSSSFSSVQTSCFIIRCKRTCRFGETVG